MCHQDCGKSNTATHVKPSVECIGSFTTRQLMSTLIPALTLLFASAVAADSQSPEDFLTKMIATFNSGDAHGHISNFSVPHVRIIDGVLTVQNDDTPFIDYQGIKKTGWASSRINGLQALDQSDNSAIVVLDFSRVDASGTPYLDSKVVYTLTKLGETWRIVGLSVAASVSIGDEH